MSLLKFLKIKGQILVGIVVIIEDIDNKYLKMRKCKMSL